jgi:hypothetical protein
MCDVVMGMNKAFGVTEQGCRPSQTKEWFTRGPGICSACLWSFHMVAIPWWGEDSLRAGNVSGGQSTLF